MYGMVNIAIKSMVKETFDSKTWQDICDEINYQEKDFKSFEQYDDAITADLVGVISKRANLAPEKLLEEFGKYWIKFAQKSEYRSILDSFSTDPVSLIESLDHLHTRLELTFDYLKAPSFWVERVEEGKIHVFYRSERDMPLKYFVTGLLQGIFLMFEKECNVEMIDPELEDVSVRAKYIVSF